MMNELIATAVLVRNADDRRHQRRPQHQRRTARLDAVHEHEQSERLCRLEERIEALVGDRHAVHVAADVHAPESQRPAHDARAAARRAPDPAARRCPCPRIASALGCTISATNSFMKSVMRLGGIRPPASRTAAPAAARSPGPRCPPRRAARCARADSSRSSRTRGTARPAIIMRECRSSIFSIDGPVRLRARRRALGVPTRNDVRVKIDDLHLSHRSALRRSSSPGIVRDDVAGAAEAGLRHGAPQVVVLRRRRHEARLAGRRTPGTAPSRACTPTPSSPDRRCRGGCCRRSGDGRCRTPA